MDKAKDNDTASKDNAIADESANSVTQEQPVITAKTRSGSAGELISSVLLLALSTVMAVMVSVKVTAHQYEQRIADLEQNKSPLPIAVLNVGDMTRKWEGLTLPQLSEAGDALVASYTDRGYVVIDRAVVLGDLGGAEEVVIPSLADIKKVYGY